MGARPLAVFTPGSCIKERVCAWTSSGTVCSCACLYVLHWTFEVSRLIEIVAGSVEAHE